MAFDALDVFGQERLGLALAPSVAARQPAEDLFDFCASGWRR